MPNPDDIPKDMKAKLLAQFDELFGLWLCANGDGRKRFSTDRFCEQCLKEYGEKSKRPGFF